MQIHTFYSDPKTERVIFLTKEYNYHGEPCFRYIHAQHFGDKDGDYVPASFVRGTSGSYGWAIRQDLRRKIEVMVASSPDFMLKSGESVDLSDGTWWAWYDKNPFFKAGTRDDWKHVTTENATDHERRQIERMIRLSPERGKFHKLLIAAWTI